MAVALTGLSATVLKGVAAGVTIEGSSAIAQVITNQATVTYVVAILSLAGTVYTKRRFSNTGERPTEAPRRRRLTKRRKPTPAPKPNLAEARLLRAALDEQIKAAEKAEREADGRGSQ